MLSGLLLLTFAVIGYFEINGPEDWVAPSPPPFATPTPMPTPLTMVPLAVSTPLSSTGGR